MNQSQLSVGSSSVAQVVESVLNFYGRPPAGFFEEIAAMDPQETAALRKMRVCRDAVRSLDRAVRRWWTEPGSHVLPPAAIAFAEGLLTWSPLHRLSAEEALQSPFLQTIRDPTDEPRRLKLVDPHQNDQLQLHEWKGRILLVHYLIIHFLYSFKFCFLPKTTPSL